MGTCKKCYLKRNCYERDEFGRCSEYRNIDEIKKELQDIMRSCQHDETTIQQAEGPEGEGNVEGMRDAGI